MTEAPLSPLSEESWSFARSYASVFGDVPSSFSVVIRSLMNEIHSAPAELSAATRYGVVRLLKSPSLYAPLFFVHKMLANGENDNTKLLTGAELMKQFSFLEIAYLVGFLYFFKRAQATCEPEEFKYLLDQIAEDASLALMLGRAIPGIGGGTALMEATAPLLGLACILKHDLPGFKEYRRTIKKTKSQWSTDWEVERWGCSRIQIGAIAVQLLGFGIQRTNALLKGLSNPPTFVPPDEDDMARDVRMAGLWRTVTQQTGKAPEVALSAKYYPNDAAYQKVLSRLSEFRISPPSPLWLTATKDDLPTPMEEPGEDADAQQTDKV